MAASDFTDLPDRFGPMTAKELRQSLRRSSFIYPFLCIHLFATTAIFFEFQLGIGSGGSGKAAVLIWNPDYISPFWWVAMSVCGILMPLAGLFLMPQEIDDGNHEILQLTKLTRWEIVVGKFMTLWGLSLLTLTSLLPYVIIRYFIGGIEWWNELSNTGTVIAAAAILSSIAIAASGFNTMTGKLGVFILFFFSASTGGGASMIGGAVWMNLAAATSWAISSNIFYHLCVIVMVACYTFLGLLVARSRLRLATMSFELKPSSLLLSLVGVAPFIVGMVAACTCGFGSIIGLVLLTFMAWHSDKSPKAPKSILPPPPNIPPIVKLPNQPKI